MQYLLEGFIVDKASGILGDLELPLLYLLAELPATGSEHDKLLFPVEKESKAKELSNGHIRVHTHMSRCRKQRHPTRSIWTRCQKGGGVSSGRHAGER